MPEPVQGRLADVLGTLVIAYDDGPPAGQVQARPEIVRLQAQGYGPTAIARSLNRRRIPTPSGRGRWHPETVQRHVNPGPWADTMRRYRAARRR